MKTGKRDVAIVDSYIWELEPDDDGTIRVDLVAVSERLDVGYSVGARLFRSACKKLGYPVNGTHVNRAGRTKTTRTEERVTLWKKLGINPE